MKRGRAVLAATMLAALVAASVAPAAGFSESVRLEGKAAGDEETTVRVTTVRTEDETKLVKRFRFKKIVADCNGEAQRISLKLTGRVPVTDRNYERSYGGDVAGVVKVSGRVSIDGNRTIGVVSSRSVAVSGVGTCKLPATGFKAHT